MKAYVVCLGEKEKNPNKDILIGQPTLTGKKYEIFSEILSTALIFLLIAIIRC